MKDTFVELKSTDNQTIYIRKSAVGAFEVVPATQHVDGHVKIYVEGYKFLVDVEKDDLLRQLD